MRQARTRGSTSTSRPTHEGSPLMHRPRSPAFRDVLRRIACSLTPSTDGSPAVRPRERIPQRILDYKQSSGRMFPTWSEVLKWPRTSLRQGRQHPGAAGFEGPPLTITIDDSCGQRGRRDARHATPIMLSRVTRAAARPRRAPGPFGSHRQDEVPQVGGAVVHVDRTPPAARPDSASTPGLAHGRER